MSPCPYEILGVDRDASQDDIKRAYRRKAQDAHPDRGGDAAMMRALALAHEILGDSDKRAEYDSMGQEGSANSLDHDAWSLVATHINQAFEVTDNPVESLHEVLDGIRDQIESDRQKHRAKNVKLLTKLKAFKQRNKPSEARDRIEKHLLHSIEMNKQAIARADQGLKLHARAVEMIADLEREGKMIWMPQQQTSTSTRW